MKQILAQWEAEKSLLVEGKIQNKGARVGLWKLKNSCSKNWNPFPNFCCGGTGKLFAFFFFLFFLSEKWAALFHSALLGEKIKLGWNHIPICWVFLFPPFFCATKNYCEMNIKYFKGPTNQGKAAYYAPVYPVIAFLLLAWARLICSSICLLNFWDTASPTGKRLQGGKRQTQKEPVQRCGILLDFWGSNNKVSIWGSLYIGPLGVAYSVLCLTRPL